MSHSYIQTMVFVHLMDRLTTAYDPMRLTSVLLMQHVMEYPAIKCKLRKSMEKIKTDNENEISFL